MIYFSSFLPLDTPTQDFVDKVKNLYATKLGDVRILIPIVNYLSKKEVIAALPKFLKLNPQLMKDLFMRLLGLKVDLTKAIVTSASKLEFFLSFKGNLGNNL